MCNKVGEDLIEAGCCFGGVGTQSDLYDSIWNMTTLWPQQPAIDYWLFLHNIYCVSFTNESLDCSGSRCWYKRWQNQTTAKAMTMTWLRSTTNPNESHELWNSVTWRRRKSVGGGKDNQDQFVVIFCRFQRGFDPKSGPFGSDLCPPSTLLPPTRLYKTCHEKTRRCFRTSVKRAEIIMTIVW